MHTVNFIRSLKIIRIEITARTISAIELKNVLDLVVTLRTSQAILKHYSLSYLTLKLK